MRFVFATAELQQLFVTGRRKDLHPDVIRAFFKAMRVIVAATDERDIRAYKGLRMEKLKGDRDEQYSIRLNDQYRLVFSREQDADGNYLLIIELVDYH